MDNGILARIPGEYVARALDSLDDPASYTTYERIATELEVPSVGNVKFTCVCLRMRKGKSARNYWVAERAELVEKES